MNDLEPSARVVGVEVDDECVTAAIIEPGGGVVGPPITCRTERSTSPEEALRRCVTPTIEAAMRASDHPVAAVGIALPGTLRPEEGLCLLSTTLGWENVSVRDVISQALGLPTVIVNGVRANLEGERHYGTGIGVDNLVCVSLGRTIEGSMCIQGRVYDGASDSACEVGHLTVENDGQPCTCGNQGCLETVASGPSVARMATESLKLGAQSVLADWVSEDCPISAALVYRAACEGDALAIRVWETVGRFLGFALSAVITVVNPQRIVVGGRVAGAFDWFAPAMFEEIRRRARMVPRDYTQIVSSTLPQDAVVLGAAWHAFKALREAESEISAGIA